MNDWTTYKLGDAPLEIIDGDRGKNYPSQNEFHTFGHCLFLSTKNVRFDGFYFTECQYITKERDDLLRKGKLKKYDLVLTTRGTIGNIGFFDDSVLFENIRINSGMVVIRPYKEKLSPIFNYYVFRKLQKNDFHTFTSGSAQPQLPIKDLKEVEILLPSLAEQKAIAAVLSSLDDKIDLLHRQNKTLEAMAETLFRQWFIEEAKEDWIDVKLRDIVYHVKPGTNYQPKRHDAGIPFLNVRNLKNGFLDLSDVTYISEDEYIRVHKNWQPEENDVLISRIGTLGLVSVITKKDLPIAVHYNMINVKAKLTSHQFIYFLFKSKYFQELYASNIRQSVQEYVAIEDIENIELKLPITIPSPKIMLLSHEFDRFLRLGKSYHQYKTHLHFCRAN